MKTRVLSLLLCFSMAMMLIPGIAIVASAEEYFDYNITAHDLSHVQEVLADVAEVTQDGDVIKIKLTSDITGRLHIGQNSSEDWTGDFTIDLNDKTIDPSTAKNEAICLDNNFEGVLAITGGGTIKTGYNNIIYNWYADIKFMLEDGKDYFTLKKDGSDYFAYEVCTETKDVTSSIRGSELVLTQGNFSSNIYTVTFDANGHGVAPEEISGVAEGSIITAPMTPTGTDLTFVGWYKDADCDNVWDFENDRVMRDTTLYALWTRNGTAFVPDSYITDENGIMAYSAYSDSFDIKGYFANEWKDTSYNDSYYTYLKSDGVTKAVYVDSVDNGGYDVDDTDINVAIDFDFINDGKTLQILYTVKNNSDTTKTYSLGTGSDVQIGRDDSAVITPFDDKSGFKMVSDRSEDMNDDEEYAQFNFFGKGYVGVTDVSDFWYGRYSSSAEYHWSGNKENAVFYGENESESGNFDSAASWHWADQTLDAGDTATFSILIGIGGADSENSAELIGKTYTYAYDVYRTPTFPQFMGDEIEVYNFANPLKYGSEPSNRQRYDSSEGRWILSEVGTYSEKDSFIPAPTSYLDDIVESIADEYELSEEGKNGIIIHMLSDADEELIGYGVLIGVDETNGYALFVGDLWNSSGAGYLLSETEITENSIIFNTEQMVQSTYSIALSPAEIIFAEKNQGYTEVEAKEITVRNTGDVACGELNIALSGTNADSFTISKNSITDIEENSRDTFTVVPNTGLPVGTYTATITVSGDNILPETVSVSFTVSASCYTITFDANGGTVSPETMTTDADGKLATLPTPTRSGGYIFKGWYTEATGGTEVTADTVFGEDTTVYAQWRYNGGGSSSAKLYTVKFETNGGTNVVDARVLKNSKLTEPTAPTKAGYKFDGWFTDEEFRTAYDFDAKVTQDFKLYAKWSEIEETDTHNCPSKAFYDLDTTLWYHEDTDYVIENGIFKGVTENAFAPNDKLTRAMLVTVLYRIEGEPATNRSIPFGDVDMGAYYANAVVWAQQNGIVNGISETEFAPDNSITREQIAAIIHRYAQYKGIDVSVGENTNILSYNDYDDISEYAIASMQYACGSGLLKGRTESTLNPKENATRAEVAAILHRFIEENK